jgi:hypothetical protein
MTHEKKTPTASYINTMLITLLLLFVWVMHKDNITTRAAIDTLVLTAAQCAEQSNLLEEPLEGLLEEPLEETPSDPQ